MAHFAEFKSGIKDYKDRSIKEKLMIAGDEAILVLWGGGPPPANDNLAVSINKPLADLIELPALSSINRKFRLLAKDIGVGDIEARHNGGLWASIPITIGMGPAKTPKSVGPDLEYDGQKVTWGAKGQVYKASSGLPADKDSPESRDTKYYCVKDHGPVPEGNYTLSTTVDPKDYATVDKDSCTVYAGSGIQQIPRGADAGECEKYWVNWGKNRVALQPADDATRTACSPQRDGFYLHDSVKGFSHGCIEMEGRFFADLREHAKSSNGRRMTLVVKYKHQSTQGGTKAP